MTSSKSVVLICAQLLKVALASNAKLANLVSFMIILIIFGALQIQYQHALYLYRAYAAD